MNELSLRNLNENETASTAVAIKARVMIEARYLMALKMPRDIDVARDLILKDCRRPSFAKVAIYNKPIGRGVKGPSIRFAEAAIRAMRNIDIQMITTFDDEQKRIVNVSATDLESNVPYSKDVTIQKTVERKNKKPGDVCFGERTNSQKEKVYILQATDDEILNKENALVSKAIRTLALRLVPGDIIDEAMEEVEKTNHAEDAKDPQSAKKAIYDAFSKIGIGAADIKQYIGHGRDDLTPKEISDLRGIYTAIRDGELNWQMVMDERGKGKKPIVETPKSKKEQKKDAPSIVEQLHIAAAEMNIRPERVAELAKAELSISNLNEMTAEQYDAVCQLLVKEYENASNPV